MFKLFSEILRTGKMCIELKVGVSSSGTSIELLNIGVDNIKKVSLI